MKNIRMRKILFVSIVLVAMFFTITAIVVRANPSYFTGTIQSASATTSVVYMTPGTATTTLVLDSYYLTTQNTYTKADNAVLLTNFTGSSTSATLNIAVEYSQGTTGVDCSAAPTKCDWFRDNLWGLTSGRATSSPVIVMDSPNSFSWKFASSTPIYAGGGTATSSKAVVIDTPTRYIRVIYTLVNVTGASSPNGAVWGMLVPNKEKSE